MAIIPIGQRIRDSRRDMAITQTALAQLVGISASYLNLIEHDKRAIGGALLKRIAEQLNVEVARLSGIDERRIAQDLVEVARALAIPGLDENSAARMAGYSPKWSQAFLLLHRQYQDSAQSARALSDRLSHDPSLRDHSHSVLTLITSIRSFAEILEDNPTLDETERQRFSSIIAKQSDDLGSSARNMIALLESGGDAARPTSPTEEADDFFIAHDFHFADIEDAAERLHQTLGTQGKTLTGAIVHRLAQGHRVDIRVRGIDGADGFLKAAPPHRDPAALVIDEWATGTTARFQEARRLVELEMRPLLDKLLIDDRLTSDDARRIVRGAIANYAAAALLFPYTAFLDAAKACRYDIQRLGSRFGGSFEQIAQRLVSLRRPGAKGIPFSFLRSDPAGNLSKAFSIPGLRMPRWGGACPLWAVYGVFGTSERTVAQLAAMPQGEKYLFVARRRRKNRASFNSPPVTYSVMLGCDASYRDRIVYGDAFASNLASLETPVGHNCRACPRADCHQRAHPPVIEEQYEGVS